MRKKAFTLVELMTTLMIVAIIASWGIPNYGRAIDRAKAQSVMRSMRMIYDANLIYLSRHGKDFCRSGDMNPVICGIDQINDMNGVHSLSLIVPSGVTLFQCTHDPASGNHNCGATLAGKFVVSLDVESPPSENPLAPNPRCTSIAANICP